MHRVVDVSTLSEGGEALRCQCGLKGRILVDWLLKTGFYTVHVIQSVQNVKSRLAGS
jgi:hypothetical protein